MAQNNITKCSIDSLGYNFIPAAYLPNGKDEYYLRNAQQHNTSAQRKLTAYEIEVLVRNRNTSDNWNNILVSEAFNPELVKNCKFYGLVRIGKLEPFCLEFSDLRVPVGLYNSTIISADIGDNVCIDNVNYLSHYVIGNEVIIVNVNELITTDYAKFGNGIIKEGETEEKRVWMEVCNENGGRSILPFDGMLPGDAFLWSRYRDDNELQQKFKQLTENKFNAKRGYYGNVGHRTVIKNTGIIKDVWIGDDAYIKGANKLKNLTINSGELGRTQIGEGCELVNGIIEHGCRIFYGAKAVRFIMASHSQLKYGARLLNSYLGNNATISCCEVLNSLIFPSHEQHHNNSFLCASIVMGQSNIAAGATIGSNHNSRSADGEIIAGRGFWPGLCVSLKHNSKFASFTIIAKGDYPAEINLAIPFSLLINDYSKDTLVVMPGYWFMYNMYALARNSRKYADRDKRVEKIQRFEFDYLAPDTLNEIVESLDYIAYHTANSFYKDERKNFSKEALTEKGHELLKNKETKSLEIIADDIENSKRKVVIAKAYECYHIFNELINLYAVNLLLKYNNENEVFNISVINSFIDDSLQSWDNIGGQLIPKTEVIQLISKIKAGKIKNWDEVHQFYIVESKAYKQQKLRHAVTALALITGAKTFSANDMANAADKAVATRVWMNEAIYKSREKDYTSPYRKMVYDSIEEMNVITGTLADNTFIKQQREETEEFKSRVQILKTIK